MRQITTHQTPGNPVNAELTVTVIDGTGAGGASHEYEIAVPNGVRTRISFQNGPIKEVGVNGITQEVLLAIVADRLASFQCGAFPSPENAEALMCVQAALKLLHRRTAERVARGVEGLTKA